MSPDRLKPARFLAGVLLAFSSLFSLANEYDIQLHQGWNLVSVTRSGTTLKGIAGDAIALPAFCSRRGSYEPINAQDELRPGLGYWVFSQRDLRSPQNSDDAQFTTVSPVELMVWNLVGSQPQPQTFHALNNLVWSWQEVRYRGVFPSAMELGRGYSLYPDPAQATLAISSVSPPPPAPGTLVTLNITGSQYLAAGGVAWFDDLPAPVVSADSASVQVIAPDVAGAVDLVLDAGHGVTSAPFQIGINAQSPTLTKSDLHSGFQSLAAALETTLQREHPEALDSDIAIARLQILALDSLLNQHLSTLPSAECDAVLVLLENQGISSHLTAFQSAIESRSIPDVASLDAIKAALTEIEPFAFREKLSHLRNQQLAQLMGNGDGDSLFRYMALAAIDRILIICDALTDWVPSRIQNFLLDRSLCDFPGDCEIAYFADFAIRHDSPLHQPIIDGLAVMLADELDSTLAALPADFAVALSANTVRANAATLTSSALALINEPTLEESVPSALLANTQWPGMRIDMPWMKASDLGFLDTVFSSSQSTCNQATFRLEAGDATFSFRVTSQAPGFGRLDASIFNREREQVFTANANFSSEPGIPSAIINVPFVASPDILFDDDTDDQVHSVDYTVTVVPAAPMSSACFIPGASMELLAAHPAVRFSQPFIQSVTSGLQVSQTYVLTPGPKPMIMDTSFQVFAGTITSIPLGVSDMGLPETVPASLVVNDGLDYLRSTPANPISLPFDLPVKEVFMNAVDIRLEFANMGSAMFWRSGPDIFTLDFEIANTPGTTAVLTVSTGVNGIGPDLVADPPNRTVQELRLSVVKAPLLATPHQDSVYDGGSISYFVSRQFGVSLLPAEEAALVIDVDPPDDITIQDTTLHVARDAAAGFRTVTFTVGEESVAVPLEIIEDSLSVFLFDNVAYTGSNLEFAYFLDSGTVPPVEDLFFSFDLEDDLMIDGANIIVGANAAEGEREFTVTYGAKIGGTTFTVVKDTLNIFPANPTVYEGSSYDFVLFFASGKEVTDPVVTISPPEDVSLAGNMVSVAFGASLGARALSVVSNGVTGDAVFTVIDDQLVLTAGQTGAFPGSSVAYTVGRESGNPLGGTPTLSVNPPNDITVNGLTLEVAVTAALGTRSATITLGGDSSSVDLDILGDAEFIAIDLSGGANAASYPVARLNVLADPQAEIYKTSTLLLRRVAESSFTMGSPSNELGRDPDEIEHVVTFSSHNYIGVFEVTQRQWELVTGNRPSSNSPADYETMPVENISYQDIRGTTNGAAWPTASSVDTDSFLGLLQARSGLAIDLPTEAQWEIGCRAGTTTALNNGSNLSDANVDANLDLLGRYSGNATSSGPVGQFQPNALGIYDMHGNVWESCRDWYGGYTGSAADPVGAASGSNRVLRGGSYLLGAHYTRSASRGQLNPASKNAFFGLRIAAPGAAGTP